MKRSRFKLYKICASLGEKIFYVLTVNRSNYPKSVIEVKDIGLLVLKISVLSNC